MSFWSNVATTTRRCPCLRGRIVKDISRDAYGIYPSELTDVNETLFFTSNRSGGGTSFGRATAPRLEPSWSRSSLQANTFRG